MVHEGVLLESQSLRASVVERTDVLDKVKALSLLPDGLHLTTQMVARYFDVGVKAVESLIHDHRRELESNGYTVLSGPQLTSFKEVSSLDKRVGRHLALFTRRTVLNVAMLLRDSDVARQVRTYLLDAEQAHRVPGPRKPVDNSVVHSLVEWLDDRIDQTLEERLAEHDLTMFRATEDAVRSVIGQTVVPLLNHAIAACGENRRDISEVRREVACLGRTLRARMPAGGGAAVDAMTGREFEDHIAGLCRRDGCVSVTGTGTGGDGELVGRTADGRTLVVRCRHLAPFRKIESGEMETFADLARVEHEADVALFVTTATFSPAAMDLAVRHGVTAVHRRLLETWSAGTKLQALRGQ